MLTGVEILLERMKTNPEEFIEGGVSKWSRVLDAGFAVMTEDERDALQAGMIEAKREHFNGEVMRVLAQGHDELDLDPYLVKGKTPMQGNRPSKVMTSQSMMNQATKLLSDEFDKAYAAQNTTSNPYQQRK
jgi:hypothetical protein